MDVSMVRLPMGISLAGQALAVLEWLLLFASWFSSVKSTGCRFPDFLQSSDQGMGNWTCKYGEGTTHRIEVMGGQYLVFISSNTSIGGHRMHKWAERVLVKRRRCVRKFGNDTFVVEHVEKRPTYQCVHFIKRSPWVVQLKLSQALSNWTNICQLDLNLDEFPWISLKGYPFAVDRCPFSGGLNFQKVVYSSKDHVKNFLCPHADPPIRVESDCVEDDGIHLQFSEKRCIPKYLHSLHFLCMASWHDERGDALALIRSANGDRLFYCLRVRFLKHKVVKLYLYLDWVCYRETDLRSPELSLPLSTSYITFRKAEEKIISSPCSDQKSECSNEKKSCAGNQCMATCEQCTNITNTHCQFSGEVIGKWNIRQARRNLTTLQIFKGGLHHPNMGHLQCISFNHREEARLRAILWGNYQNGCYPRFMCMHYDLKTSSVMRYRMGDVLEWPLNLSDESICHEDHFLAPPNMTIPTDIYHPKPWLVALRSSRSIRQTPCVMPSYIPRHHSFVTNDNRSGCITLRPDFAPSAISVAFFGDGSSRESSNSFVVETFNCVAALTYKSIVTLSGRNRKEFLCWIVIDDITIVVIKTSACNEWTATEILHGRERYFPDLKFWLRLGAGGHRLVDTCHEYYKDEKAAWLTGYENVNVERQRSGSSSAMLVNNRYLFRCGDVYCAFILYSLLCFVVVSVQNYDAVLFSLGTIAR